MPGTCARYHAAMLTLEALDTRRSAATRQLTAPGPDDARLRRILRSAVRVPDHGRREPFRFIRIAGDARARLAQLLCARLAQREPQAHPAVVDKLRDRFTAPPLTLALVCKQGPDEKIPASERFSSASCVGFALLQAAQAEGYGTQWLTGWPCYDRAVLDLLGLAEDELLIGTFGIGTPREAPAERERPDVDALLVDWTGA